MSDGNAPDEHEPVKVTMVLSAEEAGRIENRRKVEARRKEWKKTASDAELEAMAKDAETRREKREILEERILRSLEAISTPLEEIAGQLPKLVDAVTELKFKQG